MTRAGSQRKGRRGARLAGAGLIAACVLLVGLAAGADDAQTAREHYQQARSLYKEGKYRAALAKFSAANELKPSPILEYNMGRCHEELGEPAEAVAAYERYLAAQPYADNRQAVQARIDRLDQELASRRPPPASQPASAPASQPAPATDGAGGPGGAPGAAAVGVRADGHDAEEEDLEAGGEPPAAAAGAADRAPSGGAEADAPVHEATLSAPPPPGGPRGGQRPAAPPPRRGERKPLYKSWWFWVGVGGAAVIAGFIIATAVAQDDGRAPAATSAGGLTIPF